MKDKICKFCKRKILRGQEHIIIPNNQGYIHKSCFKENVLTSKYTPDIEWGHIGNALIAFLVLAEGSRYEKRVREIIDCLIKSYKANELLMFRYYQIFHEAYNWAFMMKCGDEDRAVKKQLDVLYKLCMEYDSNRRHDAKHSDENIPIWFPDVEEAMKVFSNKVPK